MAAVNPRQAVLDVPQPQVERLAAGARGGFPPAAEQADVSCTEIGSNLTSRLLPPASSNVNSGAIPRPRSTSGQTTKLGIRSRTVQSLSACDQRADALLHLLGGDAADCRNPRADERLVFCLGDEEALREQVQPERIGGQALARDRAERVDPAVAVPLAELREQPHHAHDLLVAGQGGRPARQVVGGTAEIVA